MKPSYSTVCCERFEYDFGLIYTMLYESDVAGGIIDYRAAVDKFDRLMKHEGFKSEVIEFNDYRSDFIASDREAAAFVLALTANGMV